MISRCGHPKFAPSIQPPTTVGAPLRRWPLLPQVRKPDSHLYLRIAMFMRNLVTSKGFYNKLPDTVCSSEELSAGNYDVCWNGTDLAP